MLWTTEMIATMKTMRRRGDSFGVIGKELGCTRNAAIGKAHRLGISGGRTLKSLPQPKRGKQAWRKRKRAVWLEPRPSVADVLEPQTAQPRCIGFLQLTESCCRWPYGDPGTEGFFFCGAPAVSEGPYCAAHHRQGHMPYRPKGMHAI